MLDTLPLDLSSLSDLGRHFPWVRDVLADEAVIQVMVVCAPSGESFDGDPVRVFFERSGELHSVGAKGATPRDVERVCSALARPVPGELESCTFVEARVLDGSRLALCVLPGTFSPSFTIRRFPTVVAAPVLL